MYHYGIDGQLWILLRNMYRGMNMKVKWEGHLSEEIALKQGIQQGAKLSTSLYKCYNNVILILDSIEKSGLGSYVQQLQLVLMILLY